VEEIKSVTQIEVPTQQLHKQMGVCAICRVIVNETVFELCLPSVYISVLLCNVM